MIPGKVFHVPPPPLVQQAFMTQACWTKLPMPESLREDAFFTQLQALLVSVPCAVQERFFVALWGGQRRARATVYPIGGNSCLVLLSLVAGPDAVITVLAGHGTAPELGRAACDGATFTVLVSEDDGEIRPLLPIDGLAAAVDEARRMPQLAAPEAMDGVGALRTALLGPKLFEILGIPPQHLATLTLAVCQPLG